jgi:hypothetical protein
MSDADVEAKFARLEGGASGDGRRGGKEVDDELDAMKKRLRIGS